MLRAIRNNIVLEKIDSSSSSKIFMPFTNNTTYRILNVGSSVVGLKVGELVVVDKDPKKFMDGSKELYITNFENVLAVVEE